MPVTQRSSRGCEYVKPDGLQCKANAMVGSGYCYFHHPLKVEERAVARRAGGIERSRQAAVLPLDTPDRSLATAGDVVALLAATVNDVLRGQLDPKVANAVGYLSGLLLKAQERSDLEVRVAALEALITNEPMQSEPHLDPDSENREFEFVESGGKQAHGECQ